MTPAESNNEQTPGNPPNRFAPMAPVAVATNGKCCGDANGESSGEGWTGEFETQDGGVGSIVNGRIVSLTYL